MNTSIPARTAAALALALALGSPTAPHAAEDVEVSTLPQKVVKAVQDRYPKGQLLGAEKETKGRKVLYEVEVRDAGRIYDVEVTPDGRIIDIELDDGEDDED